MGAADAMDDTACAKEMLAVAKAMREKARMAAQAGKNDLAELYGAKAAKLESTIRNMIDMKKAGL